METATLATTSTENNNENASPSPSAAADVAVTKKCRQLLNELKIDLSNKDNENNHVDDRLLFSSPFGTNSETEINIETLEDLPYSNRLADLLQAVFADVRRMGGPNNNSRRDKEDTEDDSSNDDDDEPGGGKDRKARKKARPRSRVKGRVAQLEEQRRRRLEQEAQREKSNNRNSSFPDDKKEDKDHTQEKNYESGNENDGEDIENGSYHENEDNRNDDNDNDIDENDKILTSDVLLAITFNSLRVLITILRPILDHPHQNDTKLKMKHGPCISSSADSKSSRKKHYRYIFSTNVYSCVSKGAWNVIHRGFVQLLNEVEPGLFHRVMKKANTGGCGTSGSEYYEFNVTDWIGSLFNHDQFSSKEFVAKQCIGTDLVSSCNTDVINKFNEVLLNRFQNNDAGGVNERKQRLLHDSIRNLQVKLLKAISRNFPDVGLTVYGSCLSGLALEGSHDVDVSVYIPQLDHLKQDFDAGIISAAEYEIKMKRIVFRIKGTLQYCRSGSFKELFAIVNARVPVLKGKDVHAKNPYEEDGSLSFDLCFLNDIAVVNSSLLREYSLFDNRVRILMLSIKSFAKLNKIASAADGTLSSYSWLNLVVFYLQCIGFLPTLQCPKMMEDHGFKPDPTGNRWHSINGLETFYLTRDVVSERQLWKQSPQCNDVNLPILLFGFFNFYSNVFPQQTVAASIRLGEISLQKTSFHGTSKLWRMCIEDPFETHCSHYPHDLGCHLKERGQEQMNDHLKQVTNNLGYLLNQKTVTDDMIKQFIGLFCSDSGSSHNQQPFRKNANEKNPTVRHSRERKSTPRTDETILFKGKCDNCHQIGHKRVDCPLKSENGQANSSNCGNDDKFTFKGRCNNCQEVGHKKIDCPQNGSRQAVNGGKNGKNVHTSYSKKFIRQQEERLREISKAKGKSVVDDIGEKKQQRKRNKHRNI
jgi:senataxin/terminal uridylyltransferase